MRDESGQTPLHTAQRQETRELLLHLTGPSRPTDVPTTVTPAALGLRINRVCVFPNEGEAIVVARNAFLTRWRLDQVPRMLAGVQTYHSWVADVAALPGAQEFVAITHRPAWRSAAGKTSASPARSTHSGERWQRPTAVAASPDGRWVAVADGPEQLRLVGRASGRVTDRTAAGVNGR